MTALEAETKAVLAHLANITTRRGRSHIYECGDSGGSGPSWLIGVVEIDQGNINAANALHGILADFREVDLVVFIGVAGAIKKDVAHGSVVVGTKVYNGHSVKSDKGTLGRPLYFKPDSGIIQIAKKVARDQFWHGKIRAPRDGELPEASSYPCAWPPSASVGAIASVEGVVSSTDSAVFIQIAEHFNDAQAVEMEGYGLMAAAEHQKVQALVVRGISDGVHDKTWFGDSVRQPIAAAHAAAFAMELLALLPLPADGGLPVGGVPDAVDRSSDTDHGEPSAPRRTSVVLVLDGEVEIFDMAKQEALVKAIREATGDVSVVVKSIGEGSVRVHLEVREGTPRLSKFDASIHAAAELVGAPLLAFGSEESFLQASAIGAEFDRVSAELVAWERTLPDGVWLKRPELDALLKRVSGHDSTTTLLVGPPGSGKSALASALAAGLKAKRYPVLAIKADQLPAETATPNELKEALQLTFDVVSSVYQMAQWGPVTVIIDQLDAVASYVDLKTQRLNVLLNLVKQLAGAVRVHVVLTCREFEQKHDVRIRSIDADVVQLAPPSLAEVLDVLERYGIAASTWPPAAQQSLQSPQQLKVFLELFGGNSESAVALTYQSMLDRMWQERVLQRPEGKELNRLGLRIAAAMAEGEMLWLPAVLFDDENARLMQLESAGFLVFSKARTKVAFAHQTLYEHALARAFARQEESLSRFVLDRQESLFVRPKLWVALGYLREVDYSTYEAETRYLWGASELRFHLRALIVEFLGQVNQPTPEELRMALNAAEDPALNRALLESIRGNGEWFRLLRHTVIQPAMLDERNSGRVRALLASLWAAHKDEVLEMVRSTWLPDAKWDSAVWWFLDGIEQWDASTLSIAKRVLERTSVASSNVSRVAMVIGAYNPSLAIDLVRAQLEFELKRAIAEVEGMNAPPFPADAALADQVRWSATFDKRRPFEAILGHNSEWYDLPELARTAPAEFLTALWPWFLDVFDRVSEEDAHDRLYRYREQSGLATMHMLENDEQRVDHPVIDALIISIKTLATSGPDALRRWIAKAQESDLMTVHRLIALGYESNAEVMAAEALSYLLSDRRRLMLGSYSSRFRSTIALIRATAPHWSQAQSAELERELRRYDPYRNKDRLPAKERWDARRFTRSDRLRLLQAMPMDALSPEARAMVQSELRVLGEPQEDVRMSGGFIGSPMSAGEMKAATNEQVIKFLLELPDATEWDHPKRWMQGGSVQASREFSTFAKDEPERAVAIIGNLPMDTHQRPVAYALESLAESRYPAAKTQELLGRLSLASGTREEFRTSVARAISKLGEKGTRIDESIIRILLDWLDIKRAPPEEAEAADEGGDKEEDRGESILWGHGGFSVLPGGAFPILEAIREAHLRREPPEVGPWLDALRRYLEGDDDPRVWLAQLPRLQLLYRGSATDADAFLSTLFERHPSLLGTREAALLLAHIKSNVDKTVLKRWLEILYNHPTGYSKQAWGELHCLIELTREAEVAAVSLHLSSELPLRARVGLVLAAAYLWSYEPARDRATELIVAALLTGEQELARAAMIVFRVTDPLVPDGGTIAVLEAVRDTPTPGQIPHADYVVQRTSALLPHQPLLVAQVARKVAESCSAELGNLSTAIGGLGPDLVDLAITLHRIPATRREGVEFFEFLLQVNAYGSREMMDKIDGKLRNVREIPRRRLRRQRR